ncbi:family finger-like domain protein [Tepidimonas sediminis]|uniref:Family finger-like domain protein n=1 Tax=Tepidimonas sediminis TaxID=2588941 RepID=A0A554WIH5_9BURK|nr:zinc-ribbon and DUF3426 domain-containing protein [Tepidimonas sediminis]TSE23381.1 family finger-like domain protein [Tepidimonas sediminis]
MRFITRCPSCGTSFRVVVDQLKIADGWVRCGFCQRVFDATQDLQPEAPAPVAPEGPPPPVGAEAPVAAAMSAEPAATGSGATTEVAPGTEAPAPPPDEPRPGLERPEAGAAAAATAAPVGPHDVAPPPAPEPAFVRAARRRARWRHPAVRAGLAVLALGLAALLVAQAAWLARAPLLARWPALQPLAENVCARLGCSLGPRRDVDAVVVEGSVLLRRAPDRYSFHLVLRNRTDAQVAAPALELTLLDAQEQPLVRRVWLPREWPQPLEALDAGAEWPLQFELAFDHPQASRMSGYRVVLFHP